MGASVNAREFLTIFFGRADGTPPTPNQTVRSLCDRLREDPPRPTLLPRTVDGTTTWYGVAFDDVQLRGLSEDVRAFLGPSFSNFTGLRARPLPGDAVDAAVEEFTGGRFIRFQAKLNPFYLRGSAPQKPTSFIELLRQLTDERQSAPGTLRRGRAMLLSDFRYALLNRNREGAESALEHLRANRLLDGLNVRWLEVELLASLGEWQELLGSPDLARILGAWRPAAVLDAIRTAFYEVHCREIETRNDPEGVINVVASVPAPLRPLIESAAPPLGENALMLAMAAAVVARDEHARDQLLNRAACIGKRRAFLEVLAAKVPGQTHSAVTGPAAVPSPFEEAVRTHRYEEALALSENLPPTGELAGALLVCAYELGTCAAIGRLRECVQQLAPTERARLDSRRMYRELASRFTSGAVEEGRPPQSWSEWFEQLRAGGLREAAEVAHRGASEWPLQPYLEDRGEACALADSLLNSADLQPAQRRAVEAAIPAFLMWLNRAPAGGGYALSDAREAVLWLMLQERNPNVDRLGVLLDCLSAVLNQSDARSYRQHLADLGKVLEDVRSTATVPWALDLLEALIACRCPPEAQEERAGVFAAVRAWFTAFGARVPYWAWEQLRHLHQDLGALYPGAGMGEWVRPPEREPAREEQAPVLARLNGRSVLVYTLNERSARRVEELVRIAAPRCSISTCSDHVATKRLLQLAANCDIAVICTREAAHAATGAIGQSRPKSLPTIFPLARGSASVLCALEDHLRRA